MIYPSLFADFKMWMFNADGSEGKMRNGIRCVGKYVYDNKMTDRTELSIETASGIKYLKLNVTDEKVDTVRVDMGQAIFEPDKVPFIPEECAIKEEFPLSATSLLCCQMAVFLNLRAFLWAILTV